MTCILHDQLHIFARFRPNSRLRLLLKASVKVIQKGTRSPLSQNEVSSDHVAPPFIRGELWGQNEPSPVGTGERCSCCGGIPPDVGAHLASSCPRRARRSWGSRSDSSEWILPSMPSSGIHKWFEKETKTSTTTKNVVKFEKKKKNSTEEKNRKVTSRPSAVV